MPAQNSSCGSLEHARDHLINKVGLQVLCVVKFVLMMKLLLSWIISNGNCWIT